VEAHSLTKENLVELQRALALADMMEDRSENRPSSEPIPLELLVARFDHVKVQMYQEHGPHKRPHFHIEYKRQYRASYAIDTLERIVGYMPKQYERPVIEWAGTVKSQLTASWEQLISGGARLDLDIEPPSAE
jgi:Domain of unknown function (DUF4160)